jgi:creatine kinase
MENKMCEAFEKLKAMSEYGGGYNSLTPGHPNHVCAPFCTRSSQR